MSYALQLQQERKARLARMHAAAVKEQPAEESVVPPVEPIIVHTPPGEVLTPAEAIRLEMENRLREAMATASNMQIVYGEQRPVLTIQNVIKEAAAFFRITQGKLLAQRRQVEVILPRQIGMYLAVELTDRSLPEIGRRFGGRDHTTVLHASRKIAGLVECGGEVAEMVRLLTERIIETYDTRTRAVIERKSEPRTKWTNHMETYLRENWALMPKREIARKLGLSSVAVYRKAWRLGLPVRKYSHWGQIAA